jgi:hypothetical protein
MLLQNNVKNKSITDSNTNKNNEEKETTDSIMKIRKRDGRIVEFQQGKITEAIYKAAEAVGGKDRKLAKELSNKVAEIIKSKFEKENIPTVEQVQDIVEKVLIDSGHAKTAKSYILYRQKRKDTYNPIPTCCRSRSISRYFLQSSSGCKEDTRRIL